MVFEKLHEIISGIDADITGDFIARICSHSQEIFCGVQFFFNDQLLDIGIITFMNDSTKIIAVIIHCLADFLNVQIFADMIADILANLIIDYALVGICYQMSFYFF